MIYCSNCKIPYPDQGVPYLCPACGGIWELSGIPYQAVGAQEKLRDGIWRYREMLQVPAYAPVISLGEGHTPLVWSEAFGMRVAFKCEYQNPTGSFKDRGSAALVSFLASRGVVQAVEDSSGNAGASFAAYAARAGIQARVFVPGASSGPKRRQIEAYGAEIVIVPGPRNHASEAARQAAAAGDNYASHAYLPFNLPGYATLAYEIVDQLGESPGTVICPTGQGGLLLGAARGFESMYKAGAIPHIPVLIGVQAQVCAPLVGLYLKEAMELDFAQEAPTVAEGIRVVSPVRAQAVVEAVKASQGRFLAVGESDILPGRDELARKGFYVEATSAVVWAALSQLVQSHRHPIAPGPVVVVLTGSGLKTT